MENSSLFFRNTNCKYFPCHEVEDKEDFNCMFCYCPLYHMKDCGGNYFYTEEGRKDCTKCTIPHKAKNYYYVVNKL